MESTSTALPDDINALKALLLERDVQVAELRNQLSSRALEIEHLKLTIAKLRRMQFGRKSEKLDRQIEQLELRLEDLQADEGAADVTAAPEAKRPRRDGASRKPLPEHLEREERVHLPPDDDCPDCGGQLKPLGEDVAEQLEYVRAHFRVIRHRRRSWPARGVIASCRPQRRAAQSIGASRARRCSPTSPCRSSRTTSRCTARR